MLFLASALFFHNYPNLLHPEIVLKITSKHKNKKVEIWQVYKKALSTESWFLSKVLKINWTFKSYEHWWIESKEQKNIVQQGNIFLKQVQTSEGILLGNHGEKEEGRCFRTNKI